MTDTTFQHTTLDNGLTIATEINPAAASTAVGFFAKTGSRDETPNVAGVSHFLEHMMFKGTARRTAFDINLEFDRMGAQYNAFTSTENTVYYAAVLPEFQDRALDLLGDMLRPALRQEDFDVEKNVILEEIAMYEDMPRFRLFERLMEIHFTDHPLGNRVLGTAESIRNLKRDDMQAYFDRRYSPGNITVVGVGNVDYDAFVAKTTQMCQQWTPYDVSREHPPVGENHQQKILHDAKLSRQHIGMLSPAPSAQDDLRYAAQLAGEILGGETGSRLFYALVDKAIVDEASVEYEAMDGAGAMLTFLSADPTRAAEARHIAMGEFKKFIAEGPSDAELQAAKNKIASGATLKGELPMGRLVSVGFDWVYRTRYEPLVKQIEDLLAVTKDEVMDVVRRYNPADATVVALGPLEEL